MKEIETYMLTSSALDIKKMRVFVVKPIQERLYKSLSRPGLLDGEKESVRRHIRLLNTIESLAESIELSVRDLVKE